MKQKYSSQKTNSLLTTLLLALLVGSFGLSQRASAFHDTQASTHNKNINIDHVAGDEATGVCNSGTVSLGSISIDKYDTLVITFKLSDSSAWDGGVLVSSTAISQQMVKGTSKTITVKPGSSEDIYFYDKSASCPHFAKINLIVTEPVASGSLSCGKMEGNTLYINYAFEKAHDAALFTDSEPTPIYVGRTNWKRTASGHIVENSSSYQTFTYRLYDNATKTSKLLAQTSCTHPGVKEVYRAPPPDINYIQSPRSADDVSVEDADDTSENPQKSKTSLQNGNSVVDDDNSHNQSARKRNAIGGGVAAGVLTALFMLSNAGVQLPFGISSFLRLK